METQESSSGESSGESSDSDSDKTPDISQDIENDKALSSTRDEGKKAKANPGESNRWNILRELDDKEVFSIPDTPATRKNLRVKTRQQNKPNYRFSPGNP